MFVQKARLVSPCLKNYVRVILGICIKMGIFLPTVSAQVEEYPQSHIRITTGYTFHWAFGDPYVDTGGLAFRGAYQVKNLKTKMGSGIGVQWASYISPQMSFHLGAQLSRIAYELDYWHGSYRLTLQNSREGPAHARAAVITVPLSLRFYSKSMYMYTEMGFFFNLPIGNKGQWEYEKLIFFEEEFDGNTYHKTYFDPPIQDGSGIESFSVLKDKGPLIGIGRQLGKEKQWTIGIRWQEGLAQLMNWNIQPKASNPTWAKLKRLRSRYISLRLEWEITSK